LHPTAIACNGCLFFLFIHFLMGIKTPFCDKLNQEFKEVDPLIQLTEKERMLFQDLKSQEQLCVEKYTKYANEAQCPQLKQLFSSLSAKEQQHLNTINQILSGQMPTLQQSPQGQPQQAQQAQMQQRQQFGSNQGPVNKNDASLVHDMLSTEKHVSSAYDTTIFETTNAGIRQVLNHIQKEEQQHGEALFNYMQSKGLYHVQ